MIQASATRASAKITHAAPFILYVALLALADLIGPSAKYWMLPVRALLCGLLVIIFWPSYQFAPPKKVALTLFIAVLVLFLWILPQLCLRFPPRSGGFDPTPFASNPSLYWSILAVRFLQLVVIVPFVEEIFWRGFLLRYVIRDDFMSVPFGSFTWRSFLIVTAGFCLEHSPLDWPAAIAAGALYNFVAIRSRSLSSCVLAHAVTNLLLGLYIMHTRQWGFW